VWFAGWSNAFPVSWGLFGGQPDRAPATGQPRLLQPPLPADVLAAISVSIRQPSQPAEAWNWLAGPASDLRVLDQGLADLNDSLFADPLQGDEVFA
jgi:hypothetical protein